MPVHALTYEEVLEVHRVLVSFFAQEDDPIEPAGVKDDNLLRSAVARPDTALGSVEKYPTADAKAAALLHSLVKNHAFHNGNKRTALVSMLRFLDENGRRLEASDDELFDLVTRTADGRLPNGDIAKGADHHVEEIRSWITAHWRSAKARPSALKLGEFLDRCEKAGARVKKADGGYSILGRGGSSIQIGGATRRLDGMAVKRYAQKLGLTDAESGVAFDEFQVGVSADRRIVQSLLGVLRRLAHA